MLPWISRDVPEICDRFIIVKKWGIIVNKVRKLLATLWIIVIIKLKNYNKIKKLSACELS